MKISTHEELIAACNQLGIDTKYGRDHTAGLARWEWEKARAWAGSMPREYQEWCATTGRLLNEIIQGCEYLKRAGKFSVVGFPGAFDSATEAVDAYHAQHGALPERIEVKGEKHYFRVTRKGHPVSKKHAPDGTAYWFCCCFHID